MRPVRTLFVATVLAAVLAACGDERDASSTTSHRVETPRTSPTPEAVACVGVPDVTGGTPLDVRKSAARVDDAARRATRTGHRFTIRAAVTVRPLPALPLRVTGRRLADGTSEARIGTTLLRIVDDRIHVRRAGRWSELGSASGIALDVGRELLDHPFLLRPTAARTAARGDAVATFVAPAAQLRDYATDERRGIVTELLATARRLELEVRVSANDRLVGDHFTLDAVLPEGLVPGLAGRRATIEGRTGYCPLRPRDRSPILAP